MGAEVSLTEITLPQPRTISSKRVPIIMTTADMAMRMDPIYETDCAALP